MNGESNISKENYNPLQKKIRKTFVLCVTMWLVRIWTYIGLQKRGQKSSTYFFMEKKKVQKRILC